VYDRGDQATKNVLEQRLTRKTGTFSDLPTGLRSYISSHPDEFKDYYEQRRHEVGLLKAVLRNLSSEDKRKLAAYYKQTGKLEPEKFSDIIAATHAATTGKRPRTVLEDDKAKKGGRFDLQRKIDEQDAYIHGGLTVTYEGGRDDDELYNSMSDLSVDDVLAFD
jgi:hypothetical protein